MTVNYADLLLHHVSNCPHCLGARIAGVTSTCATRRSLVQLTLKERHDQRTATPRPGEGPTQGPGIR